MEDMFSVSLFDNSTIPFALFLVELDENQVPADLACKYCNDAFTSLGKNHTQKELLESYCFELFPNSNSKWLHFCYEAAYKKKQVEFTCVSDDIRYPIRVVVLRESGKINIKNFTNSSQKISTHLLTVLIISVILRLEQRKRDTEERKKENLRYPESLKFQRNR